MANTLKDQFNAWTPEERRESIRTLIEMQLDYLKDEENQVAQLKHRIAELNHNLERDRVERNSE